MCCPVVPGTRPSKDSALATHRLRQALDLISCSLLSLLSLIHLLSFPDSRNLFSPPCSRAVVVFLRPSDSYTIGISHWEIARAADHISHLEHGSWKLSTVNAG